MKSLLLILTFACFLSCKNEKQSTNTKEKIVTIDNEVENVTNPKFQTLIDSAKVNGSILIYDSHKKKYISNDFVWSNKGQLPASTFKIPNSIIALELGLMENDSSIFVWDGSKRQNPNWEQDLTLKEAFHYSCVPCYQELARKIGLVHMKENLEVLDYNSMVVDTLTIGDFWLQGNSRITQFEQIDFLLRLNQSLLKISAETEKVIKRIMLIEENNEYKISGKTGWSITDKVNNGWFVGILEKNDDTYYFATNIDSRLDTDMNSFAFTRKDITYKAFKSLGVVK